MVRADRLESVYARDQHLASELRNHEYPIRSSGLRAVLHFEAAVQADLRAAGRPKRLAWDSSQESLQQTCPERALVVRREACVIDQAQISADVEGHQ